MEKIKTDELLKSEIKDEIIEKENVKLKDIGMSNKLYYYLEKLNIRTVEELIELGNISAIYKYSNFFSGYKEIENILKCYGYVITRSGKIVTKEEFERVDENKKISDIPISKALYTYLVKGLHDVVTIKDIINLDYNELYSIRHMGKKRVDELLNLLHKNGFKLKNEPVIEVLDETSKTEIKKENNNNGINIEGIKEENQGLQQKIKEKEEKNKLLEEYIKLLDEQEKLKQLESRLDEDIKKKEELLKSKGLNLC